MQHVNHIKHASRTKLNDRKSNRTFQKVSVPDTLQNQATLDISIPDIPDITYNQTILDIDNPDTGDDAGTKKITRDMITKDKYGVHDNGVWVVYEYMPED